MASVEPEHSSSAKTLRGEAVPQRGGHWDAAVDQHSQETEAEVSERHSSPRGQRMGGGGPAVGTNSPCQERLPAFRRLASATTLVLPSSYSPILQIRSAAGEGVMETDGVRCLSNPE